MTPPREKNAEVDSGELTNTEPVIIPCSTKDLKANDIVSIP
jgi:3-polyprenyl-4-hydroxybenzoate decarboxylase